MIRDFSGMTGVRRQDDLYSKRPWIQWYSRFWNWCFNLNEVVHLRRTYCYFNFVCYQPFAHFDYLSLHHVRPLSAAPTGHYIFLIVNRQSSIASCPLLSALCLLLYTLSSLQQVSLLWSWKWFLFVQCYRHVTPMGLIWFLHIHASLLLSPC